MQSKKIKVIFDTNVWISFLIGKRLSRLNSYIANGTIKIIITEQIITEIKMVTNREKLKRYFPKEAVDDFINFLEIIADKILIHPKHNISNDPKDNFLFDLIDASKANYLVTGDKALTKHNLFKTASIISPTEFEEILSKIEIK